jgi:isopenicillin-N N-acyltransferase-like protein
MFVRAAKLSWPQVHLEAVKFLPTLQQPAWMPLVEEMRGLADGAGVDFRDILALNVRTEIAYGMFSDGCTAFSWEDGEKSFIAQNWDVRSLGISF